MLDLIVDLVIELLPGDRKEKRAKKLRRKLVRYVKNAPETAFLSSDAKHLEASGEMKRSVRGRTLQLAKQCALADVQDWGDLCARYFEALEAELPGVSVQLPPDEPRMVYAGDKQL